MELKSTFFIMSSMLAQKIIKTCFHGYEVSYFYLGNRSIFKEGRKTRKWYHFFESPHNQEEYHHYDDIIL